MSTFEIDLDKLTVRDVQSIEKMVGRRVMAELGTGDIGADTFAALVTVLRQKIDPSVTLDSVLDAPISGVDMSGGKPDPTSAAG